jgi:hypothetical protein
VNQYAATARRLIITTDMVGSTKLYSSEIAAFQRRQLDLVTEALRRSDVPPEQLVREPGGDSTLDLVPPGVDEPLVVSRVILQLASLLQADNRDRTERGRIRLRLAIGQGTTGFGPNGHLGHGVPQVCRVRDSAAAKNATRAAPAADLVVLLDEQVYWAVVPGNTHGLSETGFTKVQVHGRPDDLQPELTAWLWVPGYAPLDLITPSTPGEVAPNGDRSSPIGPVDQPGGLFRPGGPLPEGGPF